MGFKLQVINPSNDPRGGHVATPWQPIEKATGIPAENLQVFHDEVEVDAQVDRIDPSDRSMDALAFVLDKNLAPGLNDYSWSSEYVSLESGAPQTGSSPATKPPGLPARVELANEKLVLSVSLLPRQASEDAAACFAGAAQSFRLRGEAAHRVRCEEVEMLDVSRSIATGLFEHDSEKRCMQVDRILIPNPPWSGLPAEEVKLFQLPYKLLSYCTGPVRQVCTIVSDPFDYACTGPFLKRDLKMECRFYRSLILYHDADYVLEELWLKGKNKNLEKGEGLGLNFSANYFAQMDMGFEPAIRWSEQVPDWFAVDFPAGYFRAGYGFATDVHSRRPRWPHPWYPHDGDRAKRAFSWELHPCTSARCLHLFQINDPQPIEHRIGHAWYEELYKPLKAKMV